MYHSALFDKCYTVTVLTILFSLFLLRVWTKYTATWNIVRTFLELYEFVFYFFVFKTTHIILACDNGIGESEDDVFEECDDGLEEVELTRGQVTKKPRARSETVEYKLDLE